MTDNRLKTSTLQKKEYPNTGAEKAAIHVHLLSWSTDVIIHRATCAHQKKESVKLG